MAPSSKKKKKRATNPARGFATVSVASKLKTSQDEAGIHSEDCRTADVTPSTDSVREESQNDEQTSHELHEVSPEELERRLYDAEIENLVELHAAKVRKEEDRNISKIQSDCRLLRGQAESLYTRRLVPQNVQGRILKLTLADLDEAANESDKRLARKALRTDNLLSKLWTLKRVLAKLGFKQDHIHEAILHILSNPPLMNSPHFVWGLEESLDWMTLNLDELPTFSNNTGRPLVDQTPEFTSEPNDENEAGSNHVSRAQSPAKRIIHDGTLAPVSGKDDFDVSDIESDHEPEELLSVYLATKTKLFGKQPDIIEASSKTRKKRGTKHSRDQDSKSVSPSILKLQQKLHKIESDMLFDRTEADIQWNTRRDELARENAIRRRLELVEHGTPDHSPGESIHAARIDQNGKSQSESMTPEVDDDDAINISDPFGAVTGSDLPSMGLLNDDSKTLDSESVVIRDFGQFKGMSPRRILEETCRSRDSGVRLTYKLESLAAFSCRQSITIHWSKYQDSSFPVKLQSVVCRSEPRSSSFLMKSVAAPDTHQSEAYISTIALFQTFARSSKEEKANLRLPPAFRDVWMELSRLWRTQTEHADREEVRSILDLVNHQFHKDATDDQDVVLTKNFKNRSNGRRPTPSPSRTDLGSVSKMPDPGHLRGLWSRKSSTPSYQRMLKSRKTLPMYQFREAALSAVQENQVTIICGETGCGKSTQMPAYVLEDELRQGRSCKIYCTEPRRISAITLAQRVSEELGESRNELGSTSSLIGYAIRLESRISDSTRLVYATTGIVLRMLESPDGIRGITHLVIDEVHERSIETDFLLIIIRSLIHKNPDLRVILMSATLDANRFSNYFGGSPILTVPGRTFPVETRYLEDAIELTGHQVDQESGNEPGQYTPETEDVQGSTPSVGMADLQQYKASTRDALKMYDEYKIDYELILKLLDTIAFDQSYSTYGKAILVFLPGIAEIRRLNDILSGTRIAQLYVFHVLHSTIPPEDQQAAFRLPPDGLGKIVLSTNIAETGVTIPDITCVVDTGKHKEMRFDERRQISRLIESFISRANAKQRRGRAGRVQAGLCFHLFTKARHDQSMSEQQTPEMLRLSLQDLVMRVKICNLGNIESTLTEALDPPSSKNVRRAIDALTEVGALTTGEDLTPLGQQLSKLPLDPYLGKLVLLGAIFGCLDYSLTSAAMLTSKSPFLASFGARAQADTARLAFQKGDSDLLTDYNAYCAWRRVCQSSSSDFQFCRKSRLSSQALQNIEDLKAQLYSSLVDTGLVPHQQREAIPATMRGRRFVHVPESVNAHNANFDLITSITSWSFYPKILTRDGKGWRSIASNQSIHLHPSSIPRNSSIIDVKMLSFYSVLQTAGGTKAYNASSLTPAEPLALVLLAGDVVYHPVAQVISVDGARLRVRVEGWKTFMALKMLRTRLEEIVEAKWRRPQRELPAMLRRWWEIWNELMEEWKGKGENFGTEFQAFSRN